MLFSYYFNPDKTHLLNCHFRVLQYAEKEAGTSEIMFSAEIAEVKNGVVKKKETKLGTFQFPYTTDEDKHDIDFTRVRYADHKKWIFTVLNNKNTAQSVQVGLISDSINKNPLGLDIIHDNQDFNAQLKGNNLSILESNYQPPVLTQTIVNNTFNEAGFPEDFTSESSEYNETYRHFVLSDFEQHFKESIPANTPFMISLDIAPIHVKPTQGVLISNLKIPGLGDIGLLTNGLEYMIENGNPSDIDRIFYDKAIKPEDFWNNNAMTRNAALTIQGDGEGNLTIRYNSTELKSVYNPSKNLKLITFTSKKYQDENNQEYSIKSRIDNIKVTYEK